VCLLVTGKDVYKFYHLTDSNQLKAKEQGFQQKGDSANAISTNFICHTWLNDGRFIVCTETGQILLFESNGDYKNIMITAPNKPTFKINSVLAF
jgi:hypothetical protein